VALTNSAVRILPISAEIYRSRPDENRRKISDLMVALIEGLALRKPRLSVAAIHQRITAVAEGKGWPVHSYDSVYSIIRALDPAMVTLAQDGPAAYWDRFELIHRPRTIASNALCQADHALLDTMILDANGKPEAPSHCRTEQ